MATRWQPRKADVAVDVPAMQAFMRAVGPEAYRDLLPPEALAALQADPKAATGSFLPHTDRSETYLVEDGDAIVGMITVYQIARAVGQIDGFFVADTHRRQGVGYALWEKAMARMREEGITRCDVWVLHNNQRARDYYERRGGVLQPDREEPFVVGEHEVPCVLYALDIGDPSPSASTSP